MFGRPQAAQKDWDDMYMYERVRLLVDSTADFIIDRVNWWLPSVAVGMLVSIGLIGGPEAPQQLASIFIPSAIPVVRAPPFASPMAEGGGGAAEEEDF